MFKTGAPLKLLKADHRKVEELFEAYERTADYSEKIEIAEEAFNNLQLHARLEEQLIYPHIEKISPQGVDLILDAKRHHQMIQDLIAEMRDLSIHDPDYQEKFEKLIKVVTDHIKDEEGRIFPFAQKHISDLLDLGMTAKMLAKRTKLKTKQTVPLKGRSRAGTIK